MKQDIECLNKKLPIDHLIILFSYLSRKDITRLQRVCSSWRAAAQDRCLWRNFTITLNKTLEDKRQVIVMPAVRNITGIAENDFLNVIFEYVIDLTKLDVDFQPPLSSLQVQTIMENYPHIESISLSVDAPDVLKSVDILKTNSHLKEVNFYRNGPCTHVLLNIFSIFANLNNFPALVKTNLTVVAGELCLDGTFIRAAVVDLISKRSQQLKSLEINIHSKKKDILNAVSQCTKVEELHLDVNNRCPTKFIDKLTELKSLTFNVQKKRSNRHLSFDSFYKRDFWAHLTQITVKLQYLKLKKRAYLRAIIENGKQLRSLYYEDQSSFTDETELHEIGNLTKLISLHVSSIRNISETGLGSIFSCTNLKRLMLNAGSSLIDNLQDRIRMELPQLFRLEELEWYVPKYLDIYLTTREEVERFISLT